MFYTGSAGESFCERQNRLLAKSLQYVRIYSSSACIGAGKSVLLREIIKSLRKKYIKSPDAVAVTASTGAYSPMYAVRGA